MASRFCPCLLGYEQLRHWVWDKCVAGSRLHSLAFPLFNPYPKRAQGGVNQGILRQTGPVGSIDSGPWGCLGLAGLRVDLAGACVADGSWQQQPPLLRVKAREALHQPTNQSSKTTTMMRCRRAKSKGKGKGASRCVCLLTEFDRKHAPPHTNLINQHRRRSCRKGATAARRRIVAAAYPSSSSKSSRQQQTAAGWQPTPQAARAAMGMG